MKAIPGAFCKEYGRRSVGYATAEGTNDYDAYAMGLTFGHRMALMAGRPGA